MRTNTGHIRKRRGWKVNRIYFNPRKDKSISWNCAPAKKFWVFIPPGKLPSSKKVGLVKSTKGKASYKLSGAGLKKNDRIYYCMLLDDGRKIQMVQGNSPPVIIIW